jgi:thiol oxidase
MQPHYEKVARLFNGADAVHPGIILLTRVDCALKVHTFSLRSSQMGFKFIKNTPWWLASFCSLFLAAQINTKLCDKFSVGHYPMLFWGAPPKFVGGSWEPKQEKSDIHVIDDARTADRLLNWINKQTSRYEVYIHSLLMWWWYCRWMFYLSQMMYLNSVNQHYS